jgi:2-desacetyl-2-hydroxyethyl bacteriochlorophyllide A dehydrogenase
MKIGRICFPRQGEVVYETAEQELQVGPRDVLIRTLYTAVSAGSELAKITGKQEVEYPFVPGNRAVGEVLEVGGDVQEVAVGDRVFAHTPHASHAKATRFLVKVPEGVELVEAPMVGLALVAMTALRVGKPELGDRAAIIGMGAVGNLCAQLFRTSGVEVIAIDTVDARLEAARRCGIESTLNPKTQDVASEVMEATGGHGVEYVVEASGNPAALDLAQQVTARQAEVILLGSPRDEHVGDVTPLLNWVHLWRPQGSVSLKGAHEWRYPLHPDGIAKHSMERNAGILFRMMADGRLNVRDVISHVLPPSEAPAAFDGLQNRTDEYLGVVFDWTKETA